MSSKNWLNHSLITSESMLNKDAGAVGVNSVQMDNRNLRMRVMVKRTCQLLALAGMLVIASVVNSSAQATYTSTGVTSNWNLTTTWSIGGAADADGNGLPDWWER